MTEAVQESIRARALSCEWLGENDFRVLGEFVPGYVFVIDADGHCLYTNARFQRFAGRDAIQLLGDGWLTVVHPDDRSVLSKTIVTDRPGGGPVTVRCRIRNIDAIYRPTLVVASPVHEADQLVRWIGHFSSPAEPAADETPDRTPAVPQIDGISVDEVSIGKAGTRWLYEQLPVGVAVARRGGMVLSANQACLRMLGRTRKEMQAGLINWLELTVPEDAPGARAALREMLVDGACRPRQLSYPVARRDMPVQVTASLIDVSNPDLGHIVIMADVPTEADAEAKLRELTAELHNARELLNRAVKRQQQAQEGLMHGQKLEALGELTSGVAHDFNNLIAAIAGGFQVIEMQSEDPEVLEVARYGSEAAFRGQALVERLMGFARRQVLSISAVHLSSLLQQVAPLLRQTLKSRMRLELSCPDDIWPVAVDPIYLETALINLVANARDAMGDAGTLSVTVRPSTAAEAGRPTVLGDVDAVAITVADTGCGMPPDILQQAIEPYFTTKGPGSGTGLGLAMVHRFIGQCSGALHIESRQAEGTNITLYLPRAPAEAANGAPGAGGQAVDTLPATREQDPPDSASGTVLLVDDDDQVRFVIKLQLQRLGYRVVEAADAAAALMIALRQEPAPTLVMTDLLMPAMDGTALAGMLRQERPQLPVLFMTGHSDRRPLAREVVLQKPFTLVALSARIAELLEPAGRGTGRTNVFLERLTGCVRSDRLKVLFNLWRSTWQPHRLPCLDEFDLDVDLEGVGLVVVEVDLGRVPMTFHISSAAPTLEAAAGLPLTGTDRPVVGDDVLGSLEAAYRRCARSSRPTYEHARFHLSRHETTMFERLLLPFSADGTIVTHMVAAIMINTSAAHEILS